MTDFRGGIYGCEGVSAALFALAVTRLFGKPVEEIFCEVMSGSGNVDVSGNADRFC